MSFLPPNKLKTITIPVKIPASYFVDINKLNLGFIWKGKRAKTANTIPKKNKVKRLTLTTSRFTIKL